MLFVRQAFSLTSFLEHRSCPADINPTNYCLPPCFFKSIEANALSRYM